MKGIFVNEAFTEAINTYLDCQDNQNGIKYNSFLVVCLRLLMIIYSETDIINPYKINSEETLMENIQKYGYPKENIQEFFNNLQEFWKIEKENENLTIKKDNSYFLKIQKQIIDMLITKKVNFHLLDEEIRDFYELLYTPESKEPLMISDNYRMSNGNVYEIKEYFEHEMATHIKAAEEAEKVYLNNRSYEIMGHSMDEIRALSEEELNKMNHQVYDFFKIRENAINKEYLLEKAIEEFEHQKTPLTSGNGYVDILLIMGIVSTLVMVGAILTFIVF